MKYIPHIMLAGAVAAGLYLFYSKAEGQTPTAEYSCYTNTGQRIYNGVSDLAAFGYCKLWLLRDNGQFATWRWSYTEAGKPKVRDIKLFNGGGQGVWTWIAPTVLKDGRILTDLSHYFVYRQIGTQPPTVWAQIDAKAARFIVPMTVADFGACFYTIAIRKPNTTQPDPSDMSNRICLDPLGQPLPST